MVRTVFLLALILCLPGLCPAQVASPQEGQPLKRYVMIVGANDGGNDRSSLRYAIRDAQALRQVLHELGGVDEKDLFFLSEPTGDTFFDALGSLRRTVETERNTHSRTEFIFYYSGHSDERHILFGQEKIPYSAVRSSIEAIATDVRIAILDSCASGAFTRAKGGQKRSPFMLDKAYDMKGFAFMSSSSSDEASQESERLKGSFFTHNLIAGLRGAADMNQDGRITLTESYQYAFDRTLSQTANTISGPQHPHYNIQMEGTGDVVITDLRRSPYRLVFDKDVLGTLLIRTSEAQLVVELQKTAGRELEMGLDEGRYQVINIRNNQYYDTAVTLTNTQPLRLAMADFTQGTPLPTQARGEAAPEAQAIDPVLSQSPADKHTPFRLAFLDIPGEKPHDDLALIHLFLATSRQLNGFSLGSGMHIVSANVRGGQMAAIGNSVFGNAQYFQMAGVFNTVRGHFQGVQQAGFFNFTRQSTTGVQIAGGLNISGSLKGVQLAGAINFVEKEFAGLQLSPVNFTQTGKGVQLGIINIAKEIEGAQIGIINIATKRNNFALGLFTFATENEVALSFGADDVEFSTLAIKTGNRTYYNLYLTGMDFNFKQNTLGLGWGLHIVRAKGVSLDMDVSSKLVFDRDTIISGQSGQHSALRSTLLFNLGKSLRIGGGISVNYYTAFDALNPDSLDDQGLPVPRKYPILKDSLFGYTFDPSKSSQTWVGLHLGIEYVLKSGK